MRPSAPILWLATLAVASCGGETGGPGDDAASDGGADSGLLDGAPLPDGGDGDADTDADADSDADADGSVPESCGFDYEETFAYPAPAPALPAAEPALPLFPGGIQWISHEEPPPPGYFTMGAKDPDDPDLVMPAYGDTMPLFPRAAAWDTETRCYETPLGVELLTEGEAYDLYRSIAELTTGVAMDTAAEVRTVVGIRGAYPGTFSWHGNVPDFFNDTLVLLWIDVDGAPHVREFAAGIDTGNGTVGQASSLRPNRRYHYTNDWHNEYNALNMLETGYRVRDDANHNGHWDGDRNGWLPPRTADDHDRTGGGHNIHLASVDAPLGTARVGRWSAGCQVLPGLESWTEFIYRAWTEMGDPVSYFLVDARDIPREVWEPCVPDGGHECPYRIDSFPFTDTVDTAGWPVSEFDVYNCDDADESGPEVLYVFTTDDSATLSVAVDCVDPVDLDVHLLDGDDPKACLARGHEAFDYALTPGRYWIAVDTWSDGAEAFTGACQLTVDLS